MCESYDKLKADTYKQRKKTVQHFVSCYRDDLLSSVDSADENEIETVVIPISMARDLVDVCNFVERIDVYGKSG